MKGRFSAPSRGGRGHGAWLLIPVASSIVLGTMLACGGGGGGGNSGGTGRPPVAPEPTCTNSGVAVQQALRVGGGNPGYIVPPASQPLASNAGKKVHANHLILASSLTRSAGPQGLSPARVRGAYGATGSGSGAIAVVDAFDDPTALNDFNVFSSTFSLPTETSSNATSSSNTVMQVVYATGTKPAAEPSWAQESALDSQWAHAVAPGAKIYLVEAASDNLSDIMAAVNVAKTLPGVKQVCMSFGTQEDACTFVQYNDTLLQSGVTFFAAASDAAGERDFPAESYNAVAVGGTALTVSSGGVWQGEVVWSSTGGGPSSFEPRPVFQDTVYSKVGKYRGAADIAAIADPQTGVSVYDSTPAQGLSGWMVFGGTSAATPIVAGCVNVAGDSSASSQALNTKLYSLIGSSALHDITNGSAGALSATSGWDFPTGVGTPNGLSGL